jgi:CRP-like cAMP-binding protein
MYIITQGVVSIDISDGEQSQIIDLMGQGSILGIYNSYSGEEWPYNCTIRSVQTTKIIHIPMSIIIEMSHNYNDLADNLE